MCDKLKITEEDKIHTSEEIDAVEAIDDEFYDKYPESYGKSSFCASSSDGMD